jgi:hypothetical protein
VRKIGDCNRPPGLILDRRKRRRKKNKKRKVFLSVIQKEIRKPLSFITCVPL